MFCEQMRLLVLMRKAHSSQNKVILWFPELRVLQPKTPHYPMPSTKVFRFALISFLKGVMKPLHSLSEGLFQFTHFFFLVENKVIWQLLTPREVLWGSELFSL